VLGPGVPVEVSSTHTFDTDIGSHGFSFRLRHVQASPGAEDIWAFLLPHGITEGRALPATVPGPGRYELESLARERYGTLLFASTSDRYRPTGIQIEVPPGGGPIVVPFPTDLRQLIPDESE